MWWPPEGVGCGHEELVLRRGKRIRRGSLAQRLGRLSFGPSGFRFGVHLLCTRVNRIYTPRHVRKGITGSRSGGRSHLSLETKIKLDLSLVEGTEGGKIFGLDCLPEIAERPGTAHLARGVSMFAQGIGARAAGGSDGGLRSVSRPSVASSSSYRRAGAGGSPRARSSRSAGRFRPQCHGHGASEAPRKGLT
jgi:hypothetical protein